MPWSTVLPNAVDRGASRYAPAVRKTYCCWRFRIRGPDFAVQKVKVVREDWAWRRHAHGSNNFTALTSVWSASTFLKAARRYTFPCRCAVVSRSKLLFSRAVALECNPRWCVSDPLARFARVSPSRGGEPPKAAGGRSRTIWPAAYPVFGQSVPHLRLSVPEILSR